MEQYVKVEKPKVETPIDENEIRITSQGRMRSYISYALTLLQEKNANEIVFKAMGRAINKTVTIVELIKRRVVGLHQITSIGSTDITDTWEPLEEGLLPLETTRHVSMITIILSKSDVVDTSAVGYQPPLPADQVKAATDYDYDGGEGSPSARGRGRGGRGRGRRGRGRGRGPAGNGFPAVEYEDGGYEQNNAGFPRGRGRGRGRSFRGRGRGGSGYNGPVDDNQHYDAGYNRAPQGGRGRGGYNNYIASVEDNQQYDGGYNRGPPSQGGRGGRGGYGYNGSVDDNQQFDGGFNRGRGRSRGRGGRGRGGRGGRSNGPAQAVAGDA